MGQTYSVTLRARFTDEQGAAQALRDKIARGDEEHTNYSLEHYKELGIGTDDIEDLIRIFIGGWNGTVTKKPSNGLIRYDSGFDACYGWEGVMMTMFNELVPYLHPSSTMRIYPDSGCDFAKIVNGKAVWK